MRSALQRIPGIQKVDIDLPNREATVYYTAGRVKTAQIIDAIKQAGFTASPKTAN